MPATQQPTQARARAPAISRARIGGEPRTADWPTVDAERPWCGLAAAAAAAGVPLDADQLDRFAAYQRLLLEWNARFNLTAVTDPVAVERRLFLDGLRMVPTVDRLLAESADRGDRAPRRSAARVVDVGSGGGFPGLVLKIARPDLDVTLVDATGKKVRFLGVVIAELGLADAAAVQARAEELGHRPAHRAAYDLATARAVASLPALLEYTLPLLKVGGWGLYPKGLDLAGELAAGRAAAGILGGRLGAAEALPGNETRLALVAKTKTTPARYPRRPGVPTREPLGATLAPPTEDER